MKTVVHALYRNVTAVTKRPSINPNHYTEASRNDEGTKIGILDEICGASSLRGFSSTAGDENGGAGAWSKTGSPRMAPCTRFCELSKI